MAIRSAKSGLLRIPLDSVQTDPRQPRKTFDPDEIDRLATSIRTRGQLQPARVEAGEGGYVLLDGERRFRALKLLANVDPENDAYQTLLAFEGEPREGAERLLDQYAVNEQHAKHTPAEKIAIIAQLREQGRSDDEIPALMTMTLGEFRLLSKLARADQWLMRYAEPIKLATPVLDDATGGAKKGPDGKTKTYTREFAGLQLTHLDQLVTLKNKLDDIDRDQARASGKLLNLAHKEIQKLAEQAIVEDWSVSRLKANCSATVARVEKRFLQSGEESSGKPKIDAKRDAPAAGFVAGFARLKRPAQLEVLRDLVARLGLSPDEFRSLQSIARTVSNAPADGV
jgi:ParB/RepB/Spo0J family partition protein